MKSFGAFGEVYSLDIATKKRLSYCKSTATAL